MALLHRINFHVSFRNAYRVSNLQYSAQQLLIARGAAVPARERVEEAHSVIRSYLENMETICNFECKASELTRLSQELDGGKLQENESNVLLKRHSTLQQQLSDWKEIEQNTNEYWAFYEMAIEEEDESMQKDCFKQLQSINTEIEDLYYSLLLNNQDDHLGCYLQVSSGSGGLEAQDWADTLFSMYMAWCKRHKHAHKVLVRKKADVGITQAAMEIAAFNAFGWLRYEEGVHRRSRVSPYGQSGGQKRQTSFASVQVTPMNDDGGDDAVDIDDVLGDINDRDLEWEAFNGSGPGGQHRNTSNSSVRCTHRPTGIVVVVQDERNQYNAKVAAIRYLKFKLKRIEEEREKKMKRDKYETLGDQTFGNQIRNYVYTPYQSIKDTRTKCELRGHAMTDALKNGNIDLLLRKNAEKFNVDTLSKDVL